MSAYQGRIKRARGENKAGWRACPRGCACWRRNKGIILREERNISVAEVVAEKMVTRQCEMKGGGERKVTSEIHTSLLLAK